jgi:hypothetical protein
MHSWLLSFFDMFLPVTSKASSPDTELRSDAVTVCALPGWAYARALALKAEGDDHASQVRSYFFPLDNHSSKLIEPDVEHGSSETSGT